MKKTLQLLLVSLLAYLLYACFGHLEFNPLLWSDFSKGSFYTCLVFYFLDFIKSYFTK